MNRTGNEAGTNFPGGFRYSDDEVSMSLQCGTQWDALAHVHYDGFLYNGFPSSLITDEGVGACGIEQLRRGVLGRGVLLDVAAARSARWLDDGDAISPEELDLCAEAEGITVRPGDIVLVRTGRMARMRAEGGWGMYSQGHSPGLSIACAEWLHQHDVAAVASDTVGVEVMPSEVADCYMPLHMVALRDLGVHFGEIFDLEELGDACRSEGRFEFFFSAPPIPFTGATGAPVNPVVVL